MKSARLLLIACVLLAAPLHAQPAGSVRTRIYGVEVDRNEERDRVLVFAEGPLRPRFEEKGRNTVMLVFPGAALDPSAPKTVAPEAGGGPVQAVSVFETAGGGEVRVTILRQPGASPTLSRRGGQVALDFAKPGRIVRRGKPGEPQERVLDARWLMVDVRQAIRDLAGFTEQQLIFDDTLGGQVSIDAPEPITEAEARALIDTLLLLRGFAAVPVPGGPKGMRKIVPVAGAPSPWVRALAANPGEVPLTTLIHLHELDAGLVFEALEPLVGDGAIAQVFAPTNSILLAGPGNRLRRLADVAQSLDDAGVRRLVLVPLRHADAEEASAALLTFSEDGRWRGFEVWPDARTNRLVLRGRPEDVEEARAFVSRIDRPAVGYGEIQVLPVQYANVETLAETLTTLATASPEAGSESGAPVAGGASLAGRDLAVSTHGPTHSLVIRATPETIAIAADLVAELDRPPDRVHVEVGVSEVSFAGRLALGFDALQPLLEPDAPDDWIAFVAANPAGSFPDNLFSLIPGPVFRGRVGRSPLMVPIVGPGGEILEVVVPRESYVISAIDANVRSRLLLRPHLAVLSGEEHEIFSGSNIPIPNAQAGGPTGSLRTTQNIERRDAGVSLRVEPTVPKEGPIALRIDLKVSDINPTVNIPGGVSFVERVLSAVVRLAPGEEAFLASTAQPTQLSVEQGVPFLRRIPFLGWLFRVTQDLEMSTHLFVTVRAHRDRIEADVLRRWMLEEIGRRSEVRRDDPGAPDYAAAP